jgi:hypothetical protein
MSEPSRPLSVQSDHIKNRHIQEHIVLGIQVELCFPRRNPDAPKDRDVAPTDATFVDKDDRTWERVDARLLLRPQGRTLPNRAQGILHSRFVATPSLTRSLDQLRGALVERAA